MHHISLFYLVHLGLFTPTKFTVVYDHCNSLLPTEIYTIVNDVYSYKSTNECYTCVVACDNHLRYIL